MARWPHSFYGAFRRAYQVAARFSGLNTHGTTTDVHVLTNSVPIFAGAVNGFGAGSGPAFNGIVTLNAGGYLDFAVGRGANNEFSYDGTALSIQVTPVPVPRRLCNAAVGLVSWWRAESNALDEVGGNNGIPHNGVGFATGRVGQAFSFNGTNSYVEVPDSPALRLTNQLTIEFWVKRQQGDWPTEYLLNKGGDWTRGALNYGAGIDHPGLNNRLSFLFAGGTRGAGSITDLNWHHCAIVARQGDVDPTFYLDGVPQPVMHREGASTINLYPSTEPLHIGAQVDPISGWNYYSKAIVDELSIYNRALTAAEIQAIYNAGSSGKCVPPPLCAAPPAGLASWWRAESNTLDTTGAL